MDNPIHLRPGVPADIPALIALWRRSVAATHHFLTPKDIDALEPEVAAGLAQLELWVADADGAPAGFMALDGTMIEALFLDPAHMGRGLGSRCIAHARALRGPDEPLRVDVNEDNPNAAAFYQAKGFVSIGRSPTDSAGRPWPILHLEMAP